MNPDVFDKKALIQYRLEQAREVLLDAHFLYEHGRSSISIVNRAYYAMSMRHLRCWSRSIKIQQNTLASFHSLILSS